MKTPIKCEVAGCDNWAKAKKMCGKHYMRKWTHDDVTVDNRATGRSTCTIDGCNGIMVAKGICANHYARKLRHGSTDSKMPTYGSYRRISEYGYVMIWTGSDYTGEHILIAEEALGKPLPLKAVVHHVNGIKDDNRPENLVICPDQAYHMELHWQERQRDKREAAQTLLESSP